MKTQAIKIQYKKLLSAVTIGVTVAGIYSCSSGSETNSTSEAPKEAATTENNNTNSDPMSNKGIGPVSSVSIGDLDNAMAEKGKGIFEAKCTACHDIATKKIGPALKDVTKRRTPEWIMNMILNPGEMTQKDPIAKELLGTYAAPMSNQSLSQDEARAVLEFFRLNDK